MRFSIQDIAPFLQAVVIKNNDQTIFNHISLDSRSLENDESTLFVCLKGPNFNSHQFIPELIARGINNFIVEQIPEGYSSEANYLIVKNTLDGLQDFAAFYRNRFNFPIIGITGSNGKTIVKEWLNFLLSPEYHIIRSPKSFNSQVGVPLSVLGINSFHNLGIFEAGISTIDEMEKLERVIRPSIGVLTNIGPAHDEGFENLGQKIKEKLQLFDRSDVLIYKKNKTIDAFISPMKKTFSWSENDKSADVLIHYKVKNNQSTLNVTYQEQCFKIDIPFFDEGSIENVIHCLVVMLYFNYEVETISKRLAMLYPMEMRLKLKKGINNTLLIDDSYSSDFQSLKIALDVLENQRQHSKKTLILSDIYQSGLNEEEVYTRLSQLIISNKISRIIGIGPTISKYKNKFVNATCYETAIDFIRNFHELGFENETILIKGARPFHFEQIVAILEEKTHETVLEINLNALTNNLNYYRSLVQPSTKIMVMVKAFGYGSGGIEIAKTLQYNKVDYLGVAFTDEGIALKSNGIELPIMVMNPEKSSFAALIQNHLEPEIYSLSMLISFLKTAKEMHIKHYPIHLKLDTGMHRLGFMKEDIDELISVLDQHKKIVKVKSILSHLATSDMSEHDIHTQKQLEEFKNTSEYIIKELGISPLRHILNTAGITNFTDHQYDMVRLGIGLHGFGNNPTEQKRLETVATLKSIISQIKTIPKGDTIGYARGYIAQSETKIAIIPIGYADGIPRAWGNGKGYVLINGFKATIIGKICMDMLMVDITSIECTEGTEVIIFGKNPTVSIIAEELDTIPYEILVGISHRVKRIFFRE